VVAFEKWRAVRPVTRSRDMDCSKSTESVSGRAPMSESCQHRPRELRPAMGRLDFFIGEKDDAANHKFRNLRKIMRSLWT